MISGDDDHVVRILAQRTRENLKYIDEKKSEGAPVNEFTQLLNSMLGMVISLREGGLIKNHVSWEEARESGILQGREKLEEITGKPATQASPNLQQINSFRLRTHNQKSTVTARQMALRNVWAQRS